MSAADSRMQLPGRPTGGVEPGPLSPLEEQLSGADAKQALHTALSQLDDLEYVLRQRLAAGVSPAKFSEVTLLVDACTAARETLKQHMGRRQPAPP